MKKILAMLIAGAFTAAAFADGAPAATMDNNAQEMSKDAKPVASAEKKAKKHHKSTKQHSKKVDSPAQ